MIDLCRCYDVIDAEILLRGQDFPSYVWLEMLQSQSLPHCDLVSENL